MADHAQGIADQQTFHTCRVGDGGKGGTNGGLLNPATKDLKGAGQFKNAPGQKGQSLSAAPKPKHGDDGQNNKSIVGESRKLVKKSVKKIGR